MRYLVPLFCVPMLAAQNPLAPTTSVQIDVNASSGVLNYSSIDIPAGVTVTFTGNHPVQIYCDGDAVIDGGLSVDAISSVTATYNGPGFVLTGAGSSGATYSWTSPLGQLYCSSPNSYATPGVHVGVYGSDIPFSLDGGSPGGSQSSYSEFGTTGGCWLDWIFPGGGGGGTLFLEAEGSITVNGSVTANGSDGGGAGSGGSILLRGFQGLTVSPGASITARSGTGIANGIIRLDSYGQPPAVNGVVIPAATVVELPHLRQAHPPLLGTTWQLRVRAQRGDEVVLAASYQPGSYTFAPFGWIGIDVPNSITLGTFSITATGHDPAALYQLPVPNSATLIGLDLYTAGLNVLSLQTPRFTNTLHSTVQ